MYKHTHQCHRRKHLLPAHLVNYRRDVPVEHGLNEATALYAIVPYAGGRKYTCDSHRYSLMFKSFPLMSDRRESKKQPFCKQAQPDWALKIYGSSIQGEIFMLILTPSLFSSAF